jgi:hypothetical protein
VLILPMLIGAFRPPKPDNRMCCDTHLTVTSSSFHGCANIFVAFKIEQGLAAISRGETFPRAFLMLHDPEIQVAGDPNVKRACMAAENVDVSAGYSTMLPNSGFFSPGKNRGGSARCGSVVEKLRTAWVC